MWSKAVRRPSVRLCDGDMRKAFRSLATSSGESSTGCCRTHVTSEDTIFRRARLRWDKYQGSGEREFKIGQYISYMIDTRLSI